MKKNIFIITAFAVIISCAKELPQLDRTIFIPDAQTPGLPAYTEWGYNSFGAIYERTYFIADKDIIPCKIAYSGNSLYFLMNGVYGSQYPYEELSLTFIFPSTTITDYRDLMILNNRTIDLTSDCMVIMNTKENERTLHVETGSLHFKRIQLLSVDDIENRAILSGTFEMKFRTSTMFSESFSDGRFDFGITNNEFTYYSNTAK